MKRPNVALNIPVWDPGLKADGAGLWYYPPMTRWRIPLVLCVVALLLWPVAAQAAWDGGSCTTAASTTGTSWFFAEGCTRPGFDEWLCVLNPGDTASNLHFRFFLPSGEGTPMGITMLAHSRFTLSVADAVGRGQDVSVALEASAPVVAERALYYRYGPTGWAGGDCERGAAAAGTRWLFAEGTTRSGFDTWLCVANPGDVEAKLTVHYLLGVGQGANFIDTYKLTPRSRFSLRVNDRVQADCDVSLEVSSTQPVVAERPEYFLYRGAWEGGHVSLGCAEPSTLRYFAEGTTRAGFEEYVCLMNPGSADAMANLTFMTGGGALAPIGVKVPAGRRETVRVNDLVGPELDVSCRISSDQPLVSERPMYFNYEGACRGGHITMGVPASATQALFAEGCTRPGFDEYICVMNPGDVAAQVQAQCMDAAGAVTVAACNVPALSRVTLRVADIAGWDKDVSVTLTSSAAFVAERAMYFNYRTPAALTVAAMGDVNLDIRPVREGDFANPWVGMGSFIAAADLAFANLECAISYRGEPVAGKAFTFRGSPAALPYMKEAGVDVVSQANNHVRDWGTDALMDSFAYLDAAGLARCGAGADWGQAHAAAYLMGNGLKVACLAYNDINWPGWQAGSGYPGVADAAEVGQMQADIVAAKANADLVIVSFHWGTERKYTPDGSQVYYGHAAVDAGADLVLGHHPHVVQGYEIYNGKLIAYSLGNFVFSPGSPECRWTVLSQITVNQAGFCGAVLYPAYIYDCRPELLAGSQADSWLGQVAALCAQMGTPMSVTGGIGYIP